MGLIAQIVERLIVVILVIARLKRRRVVIVAIDILRKLSNLKESIFVLNAKSKE